MSDVKLTRWEQILKSELVMRMVIVSLETEFIVYNDDFAAINYLDKCLEYNLKYL